MNKFFSLLKAMMSQDMQLFRYNAKNAKSNFTKALVPVILSAVVMFSVGTIYYPVAMILSEEGLTHIVLSLAIVFPAILAVMEGMYKSQSILFEAKDNDLLFSLPISKKEILFIRVFKLYVFQLLYSLLFVLPGIFIYAYFENPGAYFYIITAIMVLLFPIIPTVLGCVIGYIIKHISVGFKGKRFVQTMITFALLIVIFMISFNSENIMQSLVEKAADINTSLEKFYYPLKAYQELIIKFDVVTFLLLLIVNAVPVVLFILIAGKSFFKIVSKANENISFNKQEEVGNYSFKKQSVITSLTKKEFSKFFSSTVYMINTLFGLIILLIATISICVNFDKAIDFAGNGEVGAEDISTLFMLLPKVFMAMIIAMSFMTSITSSSISLEGKKYSILKALPTKVENILNAKILMSSLITIPVILICDVIFLKTYAVSFLDTLLILVTSIVAPTIAAVYGLIINLKFPKMNASSDTEIIKQSASTMIAVLSGIFFAAVFCALTFVLAGLGDSAVIIEVVVLCIMLAVLYRILFTYGVKRFKEIEV